MVLLAAVVFLAAAVEVLAAGRVADGTPKYPP